MNQSRLLAIAAVPTQLQASWSNYDGTSTIYITSNAALNQVALTLTNQLGQQLDLQPGQPVAYGSDTGSQSTLYLFFSGMLTNAEVEAIQVASTSSPAWNLTSFTTSAGLAYLAMSPQKAISVPDGASLTVPLTNLLATSTDSSGNVFLAVVTGSSEADAQVFVNVQNPPVTTNQELELLAGFAGTDLVFTGSQPNALTLYLTNPQSAPLVPGGVSSWGADPPTFQLSLIFGDGAGALTSVAEAGSVAVNLGNTFGNDYNAVTKHTQGTVPIWKLQPSSSGSGTVLGTGENATITLDFTDIIAAQPQGLTYAYLSYANIPGYNDGYYALEIVKVNPIVISSFTASPSSLANATGPTAVELSFAVQNAGYVTITNANYAKLVTEDDFTGTVTVTAYANTVYTLIANNYATGQVVSQPLVLAVSTPDLLATAFAASSAVITNALVVNGNVGLGTANPFSQLANTSNNIIGSDNYGGNSNSLCWAGSQIGYIGQFFNASTIASANGVAIKVASMNSCAFDVSQDANAGSPGTPLLHVLGTGNVGIGTSSPAHTLDVNGPISSQAVISNQPGSLSAFGSNDAGFYYTSGSNIQFVTAGAAQMMLNSSGYLGLGTANPFSQLANTNNNIIGSDSYGGNPNSLCWESNYSGYVGQFFNASEDYGANGVAIKVASVDVCALDVSQGVSAGTAGTPLLRVLGTGNVGIGTHNPIAKLHVSGNAGPQSINKTVSWFSPGRDLTTSDNSSGSRIFSGYFDGGEFWVNSTIAAGTISISSDARLKQVTGYSDGAADLVRLQQLRITDFTYLDQINNPRHSVKKVVAQQVQQVYPEAVNAHTSAIPNVYEIATDIQSTADGYLQVRTTKPHELPDEGGKMRLYTEQNQDLHVDAQVVDAYTFRFFSERRYYQLFVYGKYVDDFLTVDYDALAMLNVSATQELARQATKLQQQVEQQQLAIRLMQQQLAELIAKG
jgi:hypothetical protein